MRVLMWARSEIYNYMGGDRIQIEKTAEELRNIGVDVDIENGPNIDLSPYDIVHLFQLDWTPETHFNAIAAKKAGKPIVLSPIHHAVKDVKKFDDFYVFGWRRLTRYIFREQHNRDTWKNVYRSLFNPSLIKPTFYSLFKGLIRMHQETLQMADIVLVQTELEARDLINTYGVKIKWEKVVNGVASYFLGASSKHLKNPLGFTDYVLTVGRVEPRKNRFAIIEAIRRLRDKHNLDFRLVIIGTKNKSHLEYLYRFNRLLKKYSWITHIDKVPNHKMPEYFANAKVCISASWFETTGLTLLEAIFCGTNAVATGERAREYLGEYASYADPENSDSIEKALEKEYFAKRPTVSKEMSDIYTWKHAAKDIKGIYDSFLQT